MLLLSFYFRRGAGEFARGSPDFPYVYDGPFILAIGRKLQFLYIDNFSPQPGDFLPGGGDFLRIAGALQADGQAAGRQQGKKVFGEEAQVRHGPGGGQVVFLPVVRVAAGFFGSGVEESYIFRQAGEVKEVFLGGGGF